MNGLQGGVMIYLNREVSSQFGLPYFEAGNGSVSKRAYVKASKGSLDSEHMAILKGCGSTIAIARTEDDAPGWWTVIK